MPEPAPLPVTAADVDAAARRIRGSVIVTPTAHSRTLSAVTGADVWLKFESLQFTASFKERGARNFLELLPEPARRAGVIAASAGNHAQGVAYHARELGIPAAIVMPVDTPFTKVANTQRLDAEIVTAGDDFDGALAAARRIASERGLVLVPAFDDPAIVAGQGTVALEMLDAAPDLDVLVVPVGGGGLIAGMAIAAKARRPAIEVVGVQVESYPGMLVALGRASEPVAPVGGATIAEGIAVTEPGTITREIVRELVDDVVLVDEAAIEEAVALLLEIEKVVVEGAGAAGLAAILRDPERFAGRRVGLVLSGGNIDLRVLASVILRALARTGRLVRLRVEVADRPGVLAGVAGVIGEHGGNIVEVRHRRDLPGVALRQTLLEVSIECRDAGHADEIVTGLGARGFAVERA